jgi:hypothetical protein
MQRFNFELDPDQSFEIEERTTKVFIVYQKHLIWISYKTLTYALNYLLLIVRDTELLNKKKREFQL